ncbi:S1 RNA binding domain protein [Filifactor alocis ATCC 35896]|jgi:Ribosomal protein S1|uniref:S1 RNA binding domain protein n=1 Tax=Filifactor alocis (strain ATCC 35896 / CCUG 47790 / D40 B5) TaxID=546269 RepID=E8RKC9_FILAD|nr:S1 RNA-binding domain-containing protein [Filifactor alocis]ADW16175.1 S1 RNA binding domain protein [Filifactor alocis ATCC 35896]
MSSEMEKLLQEEEQNYEEVYRGSIVKGYVERVKPDSYYITLNYKTDGVLPRSEMSGDEELQVGDEVSLEVIKIDKNTGEIILSKKRLDAFKAWDDLEVGKVIDVKVAEIGNKGLIVKYKNSIKGFIPLSHVANRFVKDEDLQEFAGQEFQAEIIDVEPRKRRLILSRKVIIAREEEAKRDEFVKTLEVGNVYTGVVRDIKNYGMFVDLGAMTGLVHISELSWNRRDKIEELYKVDDEVQVKVVDFDPEKGRLSLSIKALSEDPFETFRKNAKVDDIIECTVKNIKEYGVFVKLNETVDGFIHISNLSSSYVKNPNEVVSQGDVITARIISINEETQKVELTMNLNPDAEETVEEEAVVEEVATEEAPVGETATEDAVVEETVAEEAPTEETVTE